MPRYFFHVDQDWPPRDEVGLELPSQSAALQEATKACGEMIAELDETLQLGDEWHMTVC
ncbi:MAG: hypothetical protein K5872_11635 [Rhizobiaceae bacterium]|nr:hypothetical protein [Rhizobiaceae bacterium]MCV0406871.1 hypothetical protein [Rhizobiaceae bacterium]